jgi:chorismate mutase
MPAASCFCFSGGKMTVRGIRGATTVDEDQPDQILSATKEMLIEITRANSALAPGDIASALFTLTADLHSEFPAKAARELGWSAVPLMCAREIPVSGSLERCIRVLLHWNTDTPQSNVKHVYLRKAAALRPDLTKNQL